MCESRGVGTRKFGFEAGGWDINLFLVKIYTFHKKINYIGVLLHNLFSHLHEFLIIKLQYFNFPLLKNCWTPIPVTYPLDCKEIQPVHSEGDQPWVFFVRNDAKAETLVLWPPHEKSWLIGKDSDVGRDWGQEEKGTTEDEMAEWHHWLDGLESEWTPGSGDGQAWHAVIHGVAKSLTRLTDWNALNWTDS